jgi:hypothetical protein
MTRPAPLPFLAAVAAAMSGPGGVGAVFAALEQATGAAIGHRLFTIMRHDPVVGRNRRVHTSDPAAYPVSGFKPVNPDHPWTRHVLLEGRPWIGRDAADIAWAYPDHEKIAAMGLGSAMNLPVRWGGRTLGAVNLLHAPGHYAEADAATGMIFAALAVPALLGMDDADSRRIP